MTPQPVCRVCLGWLGWSPQITLGDLHPYNPGSGSIPCLCSASAPDNRLSQHLYCLHAVYPRLTSHPGFSSSLPFDSPPPSA
ncbi:hypothetical protein J6590_013813 [Homalodisca vitripennis]|nr:hypothetical protein J6590_013813 [Homalodisca vitripennis]